MRLVTIATCTLNQWAMDFTGNLSRIEESIREAKAQGASYRLGPELEIPGYGCEDHFLENDTIRHSWECLIKILDSDLTDGIVCDVGMPVMHKNTIYNCRIICLDRKILLIRPKLFLANDLNYREPRYFTPWQRPRYTEVHYLPRSVKELTGQHTVLFGDAAIATEDTAIASETCEELWAPESPHIYLGLNGIEIITNGSGSHHQLRKLQNRVDLIKSATSKSGGVYVYSNQRGCDGQRMYYDGCSMIFVNGECVAQSSQFSLKEVEVVSATVDLEEVRSFRGGFKSRSMQASQSEPVPRVQANISLSMRNSLDSFPTDKILPEFHEPSREISLGPACWMWDYLRRSGASGFFLPLSGGADSAATAALVGSMAQLVVQDAQAGDAVVIADMRRIVGDETFMPESAQELCERIFHTCYMSTENSSSTTAARAKDLAKDIGAYHLSVGIDHAVTAMLSVFSTLFSGKTPQFRSNGGSATENLALQNIQARLRMVLAYLLAQLLPWTRGRSGFLLVLGSANVDEALRGYLTKYDCSSADLNPIGSICKLDIKAFLVWGATNLGYPTLASISEAPPTAELEPTTESYTQNDEDDMGMTYEELGQFGKLRKVDHAGPVSMFEKLRSTWRHLAPREVAGKVKSFFYYYAVNRHKMTTITPSYHAENYSPDDNRFDHRQFLYNVRWPWQFARIDDMVEHLESKL